MWAILITLLAAPAPLTSVNAGSLDDLVLQVTTPPVSYKTQLPVSYETHSQATLDSNGVVARSFDAYREYDAELEECYDGDTCTFTVHLRGDHKGDYGLGIVAEPYPLVHSVRRVNQHVRLCDINAPEIKPGPNKKAIKSRDDLVTWIRAAKTVQLKVPQNRHGDAYEKYGRLLAYIIADDVDLNRKQLTSGNAKPFIQCGGL